MELGFLLDVTRASFTPEFFPVVLRTIKDIYSSFVINQQKTRVGVVLFNGSPTTAIMLNQYQTIDQIDSAVDAVTQSSSNEPGSLGEGITYTSETLFKPNSRIRTPCVLVIITGSKSRDNTLQASQNAMHANITIFVIGVGSSVDKADLTEVASPYPENHLILANYSPRDTAGENAASKIKKGT